MKLKSGTSKQRKEAREWLQSHVLTHGGAVDIAEYFINTLSWSRIIDAYETLKERQ